MILEGNPCPMLQKKFRKKKPWFLSSNTEIGGVAMLRMEPIYKATMGMRLARTVPRKGWATNVKSYTQREGIKSTDIFYGLEILAGGQEQIFNCKAYLFLSSHFHIVLTFLVHASSTMAVAGKV